MKILLLVRTKIPDTMKMKCLLFTALLFALHTNCSSSKKIKGARMLDKNTFLLTGISADSTYGYSPKNAIKVGGVDQSIGPLNEQRYLNALTGPAGEPVWFHREGSCCPVESDNGFGLTGMAMLDEYAVTWAGKGDTLNLYINMYDYGKMKAPAGFGIKK